MCWVMLRRFVKNKKGASEIVGTALFLVILFFFFSNVFLWHDQVTRDMDQVLSDKTNSRVAIAAFNETDVRLEITNVGGLDLTLSRVWIITDAVHYYADFESKNVHIAAGHYMNITVEDVFPVNSGPTPGLNSQPVRVVAANGSVTIDFEQPFNTTVTYRVLTTLANSAACTLTR